jgi:hypothetical protein
MQWGKNNTTPQRHRYETNINRLYDKINERKLNFQYPKGREKLIQQKHMVHQLLAESSEFDDNANSVSNKVIFYHRI